MSEREKFAKLIEDLYAAHLSRQIGHPIDPEVTKNLFASIVRVFLLKLNPAELEQLQEGRRDE